MSHIGILCVCVCTCVCVCVCVCVCEAQLDLSQHLLISVLVAQDRPPGG